MTLIGISLMNAKLRCATIGAGIPTLGIFRSLPESSQAATEERPFLDDGSVEFLLAASLEVAAATVRLTPGDGIGQLV